MVYWFNGFPHRENQALYRIVGTKATEYGAGGIPSRLFSYMVLGPGLRNLQYVLHDLPNKGLLVWDMVLEHVQHFVQIPLEQRRQFYKNQIGATNPNADTCHEHATIKDQTRATLDDNLSSCFHVFPTLSGLLSLVSIHSRQ